MKRIKFLTTVLLCFVMVLSAGAQTKKEAAKKNNVKTSGFSLSGIDLRKPMVSFSVGYISTGGSDLDEFQEDNKKRYGNAENYDSRNGGFTIDLDVLYNMNINKGAKNPVSPGTLYAGLGLGFIQAAHASWEAYDPHWDWSANWGDYSADYYIIPFQVKARYYFLVDGLYLKAGFGLAFEDISYTFTYDWSGETINDGDDEWDSSTPNTGTGGGFIVSFGVGYSYQVYTNTYIEAVLDGYYYIGGVDILSVNPKIGVSYKF